MIEKLLKDALEMVRNGSHLDMAAQKIEQAMGMLPKEKKKPEPGVETNDPEVGIEIRDEHDSDRFEPNLQEKREKRRGR